MGRDGLLVCGSSLQRSEMLTALPRKVTEQHHRQAAGGGGAGVGQKVPKSGLRGA